MEELQRLISRYRDTGILIDTNLLLVYVVGCVNPDRLSRFRRTRQFDKNNFRFLLNILDNFNMFISTPNILTEVCNLLDGLTEPERSQCLYLVKSLTETQKSFQEYYIESQYATNNPSFTRLELTDAAISCLAADKDYLVLTIDLELHLHLLSLGVASINFNNLLL